MVRKHKQGFPDYAFQFIPFVLGTRRCLTLIPFECMYDKELILKCNDLIAQYEEHLSDIVTELRKNVLSLNSNEAKFRCSENQIKDITLSGIEDLKEIIGMMEVNNNSEENRGLSNVYRETQTKLNKYSKDKPYGA